MCQKKNSNKTLQFVTFLADAYVFAIQCFSLPVCSVIFMCVLNLAGDVVLQDLVLKQSALDDLDLPVKTIFGTIGTQSLYNLCIKLMYIYFILKYPLYCTTCHPY